MEPYQTAINRSKPSLPARFLEDQGLLEGKILDYGCGYGFDAEYYGMDKYDPRYFPYNRWAFRDRKLSQYDIITCTYVLCVLPPKLQQKVLFDVEVLLRKGGNAYISVRRDILDYVPISGPLAHKKSVQQYVRLPLPILEENSNFCIYELSNE